MSTSTRKYMSKRQRPCDFCRSRKTACRIEGHLPCRLCALHGKQCTFLEAAPPRKRQNINNEAATLQPSDHQSNATANSNPDLSTYPFESATAVGISPQSNQVDSLTSEVAVQQESPQDLSLDTLANHYFTEFGEIANDAQYDQAYSILEDGLSPEGFLARMDMGGSPSWLNSTSAETQLDAYDALNPQALGYSGDMDPYLLQNYRFDACGSFKFKQLTIQSVSQGSIPTQFLLSQPGLFSLSRQEMGLRPVPYDVLREELETLVSRDTGTRLISLFRNFVLPQYPIFSDSLSPDPQSSPPFLLAAIYMVAQPFARFDDVLSIELAYESLNNEALFKLVNEALLYEAHNPNLTTVQTILLLVLRPSTNPLILESSFKWSLHGQLVATSHTLGLQYDPSSWTIAPWQVALRRRLSSTIFALDKWLACSLGRPPLIMQDAWLVTSMTVSDNYASTLSSNAWSEQICLVELGLILGDVLARLYSLRAIHENALNIQNTLNVSKDLLEQLSSWNQRRPQDSTLDDERGSPMFTVCTLGYHYVQMTIFRAIMRPILATGGLNTGSSGTISQLPVTGQEVIGFARTGVRSSTTAAATFVKNLKEEHFHMFWPHWSQIAFSCICFLDLLMAISSSDKQEGVTWFRDLHKVRKEMRLKSNMLPVLRLGLLRIDAVFWKGIEKVIHLQPHVRDALEASMDAGCG